MSTTAEPYDWGLEEPQLEVPAEQVWTLVAEYDRAAVEEETARRGLMDYLASLNADTLPAIGDLVTPWTLLRQGDSPRYPIIDTFKSDDGGSEYLVRLSKPGERPAYSVYGPGSFLVVSRCPL